MLNDRLGAAKDVAAKLFALEEAIDAAVACAGDLTASIPAARSRAKMSAVVGQHAFNDVASTLTALVQARQHIVDAHHRFAETQEQMGLKAYAMGSLGKYVTGEAAPELTVVGKKAA